MPRGRAPLLLAGLVAFVLAGAGAPAPGHAQGVTVEHGGADTLVVAPGERGSVAFQVVNRGGRSIDLRLALDAPDGWRVVAPQLQPKLLHVIENQRFRRIGGTRDIESDVRLIAATNRDLKDAAQNGDFREDLYYRLAVLPMTLPPLRERAAQEVQALTRDLLDQLQPRSSARRTEISAEALRRITHYRWPGNIRELRNVLERALILAGGAHRIETDHLPAEVSHAPSDADLASPDENVHLTLAELERRQIHRVLKYCEGNRTQAARMLGISRVGLYKKLRRMEEDPAS